jgi:tRNA (guanine-N7-)-methyltransferase
MSRSKIRKFKEIQFRKNIIETSYPSKQNTDIGWLDHFGNSNPIVLELACGNGEYTNGLAALNIDRNYIGVDIKGERIWQGSTISLEKNLINTAFLRCQIDHLAEYFDPRSIDEIWIIHPDPHLKDSDKRKRLTSSKFLDVYRQVAKPRTAVHLKTDSKELFDFTLETLKNEKMEIQITCHDLYNSEYLDDHHNIVTRFETKALSKNNQIYYIRFLLGN